MCKDKKSNKVCVVNKVSFFFFSKGSFCFFPSASRFAFSSRFLDL